MQSEGETGQDIELKVNLKNTGGFAGDEVIQIYISDKNETQFAPIRSLRAFKRISLKPGQEQTVTFNIPANSFEVIDENNKLVVLPGDFEVSVGGGQPDNRQGSSNILKKTITLL